jgi:hypothetical protein
MKINCMYLLITQSLFKLTNRRETASLLLSLLPSKL